MDPVDHDLEALARYQLVPRLLHDVVDVDSSCTLLDRRLASPLLPRLSPDAPCSDGTFSLVDAGRLGAGARGVPTPAWALPVVRTAKMGELLPEVRRLADLEVPALVLDVSHLGDSAPFGEESWRPRTREDLAELAAAAGRPLWLYGVLGPEDAAVAAEAGLDAIVVHAGAARHLGGPATIDALPDVIDAVAGMLAVLAGGPVANGVDVYRYLAVGADAVVVEGDRALQPLEAELRYAMRLTGCATLADIGYDAIFAPVFDEP
jgi:4-hydroxymandelate oxidase